MWYSSKMMKKSYKKYPKGTEQRSLSEELSLTGMPPDMIDKLRLRTKEDYPVYRVPKDIYPKELSNRSLSDKNPQAQLFYPENKKRKILNIGDLDAETPFAILSEYSPFSIIHESTHLSDLEKGSFFNRLQSRLDYALDDYELSAFFNEIIYFLYSKNKASFINYIGKADSKVLNLKDFKKNTFNSHIFLWGLIKDSIEKNGLQKTIDMKEEIIEKTKEQIIDSLIPHILDVYMKTTEINDQSKEDLLNYLNKLLFDSSTISKETIEKIQEKLLEAIESMSRDWIPQPTKDEIYNFYGERYLKDFS